MELRNIDDEELTLLAEEVMGEIQRRYSEVKIVMHIKKKHKTWQQVLADADPSAKLPVGVEQCL